MGTQAVGHSYDLFFDCFKPKKDIFGVFADKYFHGSWQKHETWYSYGLYKGLFIRIGRGHTL